MAIIKCPECGKRISSHALACPYCGLPLLFSRFKRQVRTLFDIGRGCLKQFIRLIVGVIRKFLPHAMLTFLAATVLVFAKNIYFISYLENEAVNLCSSAVGRKITNDDSKIIDVPSDIEWSSFESRIGKFYDFSHFDFAPPYMWGYIDVIGHDSKQQNWICTPLFRTSKYISLNPYRFERFFIRIKD